MSPQSKASLSVRDNRTGKTYEIPIANNTIDANQFKQIKAPRRDEPEEHETERGLRVFDRGFLNTAVISSTITYIDGANGILRYRGYPIQELAEKSSHLETAYLLIYGSLPTAAQYRHFHDEIMHHASVHVDAEELFRSFRYGASLLNSSITPSDTTPDAHPMSILTSAFAALGSFYPGANPSLQGQTLFTKAKDSFSNLQNLDKQIFRLIGKAPTLAAMAYRVRQGRHFVAAPPGLSYTGSFLYQLDCLGEQDYKPNPVLEKALDVLFLLHADHELNASTTTVLQAGSSLTDPYSAVATGCASLYGPLHGGANEAVIRMLISIGEPENVPKFIEQVKRRERVLSGFGHRVYKTTDPRSYIVRKTADEVFKVTGKDQLLETAMVLHDLALKDEYFIKRNLYPNVDFWSGLIYKAMGFPMDYFPVMFAVPRIVGWLAHWRQMILSQDGVKIWRPRQIYVGSGQRPFVPIEERKADEKASTLESPTSVYHSGQSKRSQIASYAGHPATRSKL